MSTVLFLGFDSLEIEKWLQKPKTMKVVVFDNSYENRDNFEKLYKRVVGSNTPEGSRRPALTMYEGCIPKNIEAYLQKKEVESLDHIYAGNLELINSCKNKNQDGVHECL